MGARINFSTKKHFLTSNHFKHFHPIQQNFQDHPVTLNNREVQYAHDSAYNTVCYTPYPSNFKCTRDLLNNSVNSGPARHGRLCGYQPGIK